MPRQICITSPLFSLQLRSIIDELAFARVKGQDDRKGRPGNATRILANGDTYYENAPAAQTLHHMARNACPTSHPRRMRRLVRFTHRYPSTNACPFSITFVQRHPVSRRLDDLSR